MAHLELKKSGFKKEDFKTDSKESLMDDVVEIRIVNINPALATHILENKNNRNRKLSSRVINSYASEMERSQWNETATNAIRFDINGNCVNGQHVCSAMVQANKRYNFLWVSGLSEEAIHSMDNTKKRTAANMFQIEGVVNATDVASGLSAYIKLDIGGMLYHKQLKEERHVTPNDLWAVYCSDEDRYQKAVRYGKSWAKKSRGMLSKSFYMAYFLHLTDVYDEDFVYLFMEDLATGAVSNPNDPARQIREKFANHKHRHDEDMKLKFREYYLRKAFNQRLVGKTVKNILLTEKDKDTGVKLIDAENTKYEKETQS